MNKLKIGVQGNDSRILEETINTLSISGNSTIRFSSPGELVGSIRSNEPVEAIILISEYITSDTPEFIRHLRKMLDWEGILILVTNTHHEQIIISCFLSGADDVISPPHTPLELSARLYSIRRRCAPLSEAALGKQTTQESVVIDFQKYRIDKKNLAIYLSGSFVKLTEKEYLLATLFFENIGKTLSRNILLPMVWGISSHIPTRTLDTHVSRLRKKLQLYGEYGYELKSIYQHGYRLQAVASSFSYPVKKLTSKDVNQLDAASYVHTSMNYRE